MQLKNMKIFDLSHVWTCMRMNTYEYEKLFKQIVSRITTVSHCYHRKVRDDDDKINCFDSSLEFLFYFTSSIILRMLWWMPQFSSAVRLTYSVAKINVCVKKISAMLNAMFAEVKASVLCKSWKTCISKFFRMSEALI